MEEKKKDKKPIRLLNILIGVFVVIFIFFLLVPHRCPTKIEAFKIVCNAQLHQLFIAISSYKEDNQRYPILNQWCDLLESFSDPEHNKCPADEIGPCSYAMNENMPAEVKELPGDLVVLFESTPGWNRVGGADDVVTDRHDKKNPGANIAFADGRVEFVRAEDISKLRWTIED
jgi:prepilin-type processing-associated H-X9-DG protein